MNAAIDELSTSDLIKRINEEVGLVLAADRSTYTKAVAIGEALVALRQRRNSREGWQAYLKEKCPKLAYETATLYIRLCENQDAILAAANAQKHSHLMNSDITLPSLPFFLRKSRCSSYS
jgi:hypothetical protein